ncbi:hypothetical protein DFP93_11788 [Aneurinibacillus soli]|uniref:Uncharacterized protein n=1 Tax=Aneurinibacillus soli TaxID=1500254 RepID=A0A0U5C9A7_9BACL|nr:hypothetical protein [Aneurinibacillus soli]PYE59515.1 hypothetical protein DFP93_11788 [Aneurinibacillus soli]BAU29155.1 hypothetical protein CB4_03336 [Aneurinibacillus soli]
MRKELQDMKPAVALPDGRLSPDETTMGHILDVQRFADIYEQFDEDGQTYFPRLTCTGDVEAVIVHDDIDSFGNLAEAQVYIDFTRHKQTWIAVLWMVDDPDNPLGFPFSFPVEEDTGRYLAIRLIEQDVIWVHHLAPTEEGIMHIYSESISFPDEEKDEAVEHLLAAYRNDLQSEAEEEVPARIVNGSDIDPARFLDLGFTFYFDYSALLRRLGEEAAKEQVMGAVYRALWMMRRHPSPQARAAELYIWVGEGSGQNRAGEDTHLLGITMTPQLLDVYQIINTDELDANPLATMLMSITEYQRLEEEMPLSLGHLPIIGYVNEELLHIDWDGAGVESIASVYGTAYPQAGFNPYRAMLEEE